ncbi:hypothetical protein FBQ96_04250 [Nitrospirales bacterium NOB]|nr:MAG: Sulfite exporter TauE/SafE [Nitrospira sp. OLB3]MBV6468539.1 hypothetical protein [Nitrospirota bacterium]MCE7965231.1 hypothetical protein [Nitrospira sp. NTP2]MCK6491841.1 TSUP family transporter [Nitrospira sp.]MDL1888786.1 hypothetical protein [Nitrospirales bacterium NOB]MEB2340008.1 TSUP family transporter [Nitrospirales bacterium]
MQWDILATVLLTATIQSLFGVGVLLFGTPILLVLGHEFLTVLTILLPISLTINILQVAKDTRHVDRPFYRQILTLTIPGVILCLLLVAKFRLNIGGLVGLFLIVAALKSVYGPFNQWIESFVRWERIYFMVMGIVHGLTNLGGSLLTAIIHTRHYEKDRTRATTAAAYGTFALFQLITLGLSLGPAAILSTTATAYMALGVGTFLLSDRFLYGRLDSARYRTSFATFLFFSGLALIAKSLFL